MLEFKQSRLMLWRLLRLHWRSEREEIGLGILELRLMRRFGLFKELHVCSREIGGGVLPS